MSFREETLVGLTASHNRYQSFGLKELFCTVLPKQQGTHTSSPVLKTALCSPGRGVPEVVPLDREVFSNTSLSYYSSADVHTSVGLV